LLEHWAVAAREIEKTRLAIIPEPAAPKFGGLCTVVRLVPKDYFDFAGSCGRRA
jgi:hypothetical protein